MTRPSPADIDVLAAELHRAEHERRTISQLSLRFPEMTVEDAYAVQRALVELKVADGRVIKGRKVGLTSKTMQRAVSIDEPDFGALFDDMFFADGGGCRWADLSAHESRSNWPSYWATHCVVPTLRRLM